MSNADALAYASGYDDSKILRTSVNLAGPRKIASVRTIRQFLVNEFLPNFGKRETRSLTWGMRSCKIAGFPLLLSADEK